MLEIANSAERDKANELIEQMKSTGQIGEFFGDLFYAICDLKENGMEPAPYEISSSENIHFDTLEQEFANLISGKGLSAEA